MTYRAISSFWIGLLLCAGSFACGSAEPTLNSAEERVLIEEAVNRHLAKRSDLDFSSMGVTVSKVNLVDDDKADAVVQFQTGEGSGASIEMTYSLLRTDGTWNVEGPPKGVGVGQGSQVPPPTGGVMPPNHPPVGGSQQQELPSGHPQVN
jgi:hypothetical protein